MLRQAGGLSWHSLLFHLPVFLDFPPGSDKRVLIEFSDLLSFFARPKIPDVIKLKI